MIVKAGSGSTFSGWSGGGSVKTGKASLKLTYSGGPCEAHRQGQAGEKAKSLVIGKGLQPRFRCLHDAQGQAFRSRQAGTGQG
jgi:hypothetical protein